MHIHIKTNTFSHSSYRHLPQGLRMLKRSDLRKVTKELLRDHKKPEDRYKNITIRYGGDVRPESLYLAPIFDTLRDSWVENKASLNIFPCDDVYGIIIELQ